MTDAILYFKWDFDPADLNVVRFCSANTLDARLANLSGKPLGDKSVKYECENSSSESFANKSYIRNEID